MAIRVIVLGGTGMLGSMVADALARDPDLKVTATLRRDALLDRCRELAPDITWQHLSPVIDDALSPLSDFEWIINAIGITKPLIRDDNPVEIEQAIRINALLPHAISRQAGRARCLQIATDCVFSGQKGRYVESDPHDALDGYGKTKSLGEAWQANMHHLRCSIIGPEPKEGKFLQHWFLGQPQGATIQGFTNHLWNGLTTTHFARICQGIIKQGLTLPRVQHVIPAADISKFELLRRFAVVYGREDINIQPTEAPVLVDRTLRTENESVNLALWNAAGYPSPPTVQQMLAELAAFDFRLVGLEDEARV
jgi:dTDP-4-dehydrorhamnose reductase